MKNKLKNPLQNMKIQDENRFYFVLQLVFAAAQILLFYVAVAEKNLLQAGIIIFAVFGAGMMLLAGKCWQSRAARGFGRVFSGVVIAFLLVVSVAVALSTGVWEPLGTTTIDRPFSDYLGQIAANLCLYIQPIALLLFPTYAIATRRVRLKSDITLLKISTCLLVILSAITWGLSYEAAPTRLDYTAAPLDIPCRVLLIAYFICTLASLFSSIILYPGLLKEKMDAIRAKHQAADKTESKTAE